MNIYLQEKELILTFCITLESLQRTLLLPQLLPSFLQKSCENGSIIGATKVAKDSWKAGQSSLIEFSLSCYSC